MPWETFYGRSKPAGRQAQIRIQTKGVFTINKAAHDLLDHAEAVELLWDADRQMIGFRPISPEEPHAYPVRPTKKQGVTGSTYIISAKAFFATFRIPIDTLRQFTPRKVDDVVAIDLQEKGIDAARTRTQGRGQAHTAQ